MQVLFLQSAHHADDDRVWYHEAATLRAAGMDVRVCGMADFRQFVPAEKADVVIVDTPRAAWKARHYEGRLVYDVTEWYPAQRALRQWAWPKRWVRGAAMYALRLWAGWRADGFLFGEYYKAQFFRRLFPRKASLDLPYYPDLQLFTPTQPRDIRKECRVLYAGSLRADKGWTRVVETLERAAERLPETRFVLDVISADVPGTAPRGVGVHHLSYMPLPEFCRQLSRYDVFLDLREVNSQTGKSLPIKLFYYMACGRPVIFSEMQGITKGVPEFAEMGQMVADSEQAAEALCRYITEPAQYRAHCQRARELAETQYNWGVLRQGFVDFIQAMGATPSTN